MSLEHLGEVLGLEGLAILDDLTGRAQTERLLPACRRAGSQKPHPEHQRRQPSEDHDRERIHRGRSLNVAWEKPKDRPQLLAPPRCS
jgi:hypothetical protein